MEPRGLVPFYRWTPTSWVRKEGRGANYVSQGLLPDMAWGRWTEWSHVVSQGVSLNVYLKMCMSCAHLINLSLCV